MEDNQIIDLYWARSESAITETANKYGPYCHTVAYNILKNKEDSEECVNDTYRKAWDSMPPQRPQILRAFLAKITRNLSLNRYEKTYVRKTRRRSDSPRSGRIIGVSSVSKSHRTSP